MKLASFLAVLVAFSASSASAETPAEKVASSAVELRSAIADEGLTAAAQAPLIARLARILNAAKCTTTAKGTDCSQASPDQLATLQDDLQQLRHDFTGALKQAAATKALAETFAAGAAQVRSAISGEGLSAAAQATLLAQLNQILSAAKCTSTANGVDCAQASQDQLATAQTDLQQLRYSLTAALKQPAAGQALPPASAANTGQPQNASAPSFVAGVNQVRSAIVDSGLTAAAQAPLIARFQTMLNAANCTNTAKGLDCSQASPLQLATAQAALQSIGDALTAALAQAAATQGLAQKFAADAGTLKSAIVDSGLTASAQAPLITQFTTMLNAARCTNTTKGVDCSSASQAQIQMAQATLQLLRDGLTAALKQAAAALALVQGTFAAKGDLVLNALNDPKMIVVQTTYLPRLRQILNAAKCTLMAKSVDCSQAALARLAAAQADLDTLSLEVGTIASLKQAAGGLALSQQSFAASAGRLLLQINTVKMSADVRPQLIAQFANVLSEANCTNTTKSVDCSRAEQSQLVGAQAFFDRLSYQVQLAPTRP